MSSLALSLAQQNKKTLTLAAIAVALVALAWLTAPRQMKPEQFADKGEAFYPNFTDPNSAASIEITEFDPTAGAPSKFEVTFKNGMWTLPSHNDYPADAKDRLAKTAAGVIDVIKDDIRSDSPAEHAGCGVLDPADATAAGADGKGRRVIFRDQAGQLLSDLIIGNEVPGKSGFRFVRLPDQKRIYLAKMDVEISSKFEDWIERDLLRVEKNSITKIMLRDYSINERTGQVDERGSVELEKNGDKWRFAKGSGSPDSARMDDILKTLDELVIVGVRPKPKGLTDLLSGVGLGQISQSDVLSLQSKGYYLTPQGILLSNEGELQFSTTDGAMYILRFGEIAPGSGLELTAGADATATPASGDNRYLFLSAQFNPSSLQEPPKPSDLSYQGKPDSLLTDIDRENRTKQTVWEQWKETVEKNRKAANFLGSRFAAWYYVISNESFTKLHADKKSLTKS